MFSLHPPPMNLVNLSGLGSLIPSSLLNLITTFSEFLFLFFRLFFAAAHNSLSFPHNTKYLIHFNKVNNQLSNKNRQIFINPISNSFRVQTTSKCLGCSLMSALTIVFDIEASYKVFSTILVIYSV